MQGDMETTEDSQENMYSRVTRGTRADKVPFAPGSARSRREPDGRTGRLVTSTSASVAVGRGTKFQVLVTGDKSWFFLETSVRSGLSRSRDDLPSRPKQNIQMKRVSFQSFGLSAVSMADLLFRKENIIIQHSSPMLVLPICKQTFAQEYNKRH
jgi:hypothetical protein